MNGQNNLSVELLPYLAIIIVLILFIAFCVKMVITTSKAKKERRQKTIELRSTGATNIIALNHVNGLPIAENILCQIRSWPDKYEFVANNMNFNLSKHKVTDVCMKTDVDIQQQYVSSAGGAVGGFMLFGPLGAVIGGRAKKKTMKQTSTYLIFTYQDNGAVKYIGFDATYSITQASKIVAEFNQQPKATTNINL